MQLFYGESISLLPREGLPDLVCSSSLQVGEVLSKAQAQDTTEADETHMLLKCARILRDIVKSCKVSQNQALDEIFDISIDAAKKMVPKMLLKYAYQLLTDTKMDNNTNHNLLFCGTAREKTLLVAQQLLYSICSMKTPLSGGMAFDTYSTTQYWYATVSSAQSKIKGCISHQT